MANPKMYDAYRDSILIGVHQQNFKNGAFKNSINKSTGVINSLNILLASAHLSPSEKEMVESCRKTFISIHKRWSDENPNLLDVFTLHTTFVPLFEMFEKDTKDQGIYVPPSSFQVINPDGSVEKTMTMNADKETMTETKGGIHGIPAGAPEEFVRDRIARSKDLGFIAKETDADVLLADYYRQEAVGDEKMGDKSKDPIKLPTIKENKEKKSKVADEKTDFGKGFARNLRGAFM